MWQLPFFISISGERSGKSVTFLLDDETHEQLDNITFSDGKTFMVIGVAGFKYDGSYYNYKRDIQNNVIAILDSNGNEVVQYVYDAWGNHDEPASEIGKKNPFRYRSYFYDPETQLYFLKTRYYDPSVGRFLNADSFRFADPEATDGLNLYVYCANNPVKYVDPNGEFWGMFFFSMLITGLIGGAIKASTAAIRGEDSQSCWAAFAGGFLSGAVLGGAMVLGGGLAVGAYTATTASIAGTTMYLTAGTFIGGGLSYVAENGIKGKTIDWGDAAKRGGLTLLQGLFSYGVGYAVGGAGLWESLKSGNGFFATIKSNGFRGTISYLKSETYPLVMRTFIKSIFTSPWDLIKP